jgi:hypothetical protein
VHFFLLLLLLVEATDEPLDALEDDEPEVEEVSVELESLALEPEDVEVEESSEDEDDVSVEEEEVEPPERFCCSIQLRRSAVKGPTERPE